MRRALSNLGGEIRTAGDPQWADVLRSAWERAASEPPDVLTHGFHSWPARMHWAIARTMIEAMEPRSLVDPFCGGGTVLVEAYVANVRALGVDLNPLAERVCEAKLDVRDDAGCRRLLAAAEQVAEKSEARVRARVPITVRLPPRETQWYSPHVLKELGGLLEEIRALEEVADRRTLETVFSSIVVKVSRQRADTAERPTERRIRKGLSTELFLRKARELVERLQELSAIARGPKPEIRIGDARDLARLAGRARFDLVLTSPPYGGTYDYALHHARRMAWLGLDDRALRRLELGARRASSEGSNAARRWDREVDRMLAAMAAVLQARGAIAMVIGDAQIGGERIEAPAQIAALAQNHDLVPVALASQRRIDRTGRRPREEHLVLLRNR